MCRNQTRFYKWGSVQESNLNDSQKCIPTSEVVFVHEFRIFIALIERANEHQFGPQDTIRKVLKGNYLNSFTLFV
jgi:hypothetical protein